MTGHLPPALFGMAMQQMRIRPVRRLPLAFGWLTKRGDAATARWLGPVLTQRDVRRDTVRVLRGIGASRRLLLEAAESLPSFDRPALVVWASQGPRHAARARPAPRRPAPAGAARGDPGQLHADPARPAGPARRRDPRVHRGNVNCGWVGRWRVRFVALVRRPRVRATKCTPEVRTSQGSLAARSVRRSARQRCVTSHESPRARCVRRNAGYRGQTSHGSPRARSVGRNAAPIPPPRRVGFVARTDRAITRATKPTLEDGFVAQTAQPRTIATKLTRASPLPLPSRS